MELFEGRKIEKEAYQNMYYMNSLSLQQDRYLCKNNYLIQSDENLSDKETSYIIYWRGKFK